MAIEEDVIAAIKEGKAKMRPKAYFVLRNAAGVLMGAIVLFVLAYLVGFILFALHESGVWFEPGFGAAGWSAFFRSLPWVLIALIALLFVTLAALMRRYPFSYRWPIIFSLLGVIFLVATGNLLIAQTSLQTEIFNRSVTERLGFIVQSPDDIHRGQVLAPIPGGFVLTGLSGATSAVLVATETYLQPGADLAPGSEVVVFGDRNGSGTIQAIGVDEISPCPGCSK